jgi:hypothetical protein
MNWNKKTKPDPLLDNLTPEQEREKREQEAKAYIAAQEPYRWISRVEDLLRRAFVPDQMIRDRLEARAPFRGWSPEEAEAQIVRGISNRDLLAHRIGRETATRRWQSEVSDRYNAGAGPYRWRLADVGAVLADLGWLPMPDNHPWKRRKPATRDDMAERERMAEATAAQMVGV